MKVPRSPLPPTMILKGLQDSPRGYSFQSRLSDHNHPGSSAVRFALPISRDVGDSGDLGDFHGPLPASFSQRPHPPIALCCKQKPNLNSTARSTERSKPFFVFFSGPIRFNFSLLFPFLLSGRQRVASCPKARGAPIAAPQTVIVSDRRMPESPASALFACWGGYREPNDPK